MRVKIQKAIIAEPGPDQGGKKARPLGAPWWLRDSDWKVLSESFSMPEVWVLAGSRGHNSEWVWSGRGELHEATLQRVGRTQKPPNEGLFHPPDLKGEGRDISWNLEDWG